MARMSGKVVIVTGGTSGIGRACAEQFAKQEARVVIAGRRPDAGRDLAALLGDRAFFVAADVLNEDDVRGLVARTLEHFGRVDCVISNAGATSDTRSIVDTDSAAFERDFALHVRAPFLAMKYAAPSMLERGNGSFINMSSISAHRAGFNTFGYEVAKAAVVHLTRCAAIELGERGVRVNSISPGPTLTGIFAKSFGHDDATADAMTTATENFFRGFLPTVQAVPGMIRPDDIAAAALFLASDDARYINGHDLIVDGGITAGRPASQMSGAWAAFAKALG